MPHPLVATITVVNKHIDFNSLVKQSATRIPTSSLVACTVSEIWRHKNAENSIVCQRRFSVLPSSTQIVAFDSQSLISHFSLLGMPAQRASLYILLALISFFFSFLISFLMISWRTIISGSAGPIFAIFHHMKAL